MNIDTLLLDKPRDTGFCYRYNTHLKSWSTLFLSLFLMLTTRGKPAALLWYVVTNEISSLKALSERIGYSKPAFCLPLSDYNPENLLLVCHILSDQWILFCFYFSQGMCVHYSKDNIAVYCNRNWCLRALILIFKLGERKCPSAYGNITSLLFCICKEYPWNNTHLPNLFHLIYEGS